MATGVDVKNILEFIIYKSSYKSTVFVSGQPCQPSLMFMSKAGAYLRVSDIRPGAYIKKTFTAVINYIV